MGLRKASIVALLIAVGADPCCAVIQISESPRAGVSAEESPLLRQILTERLEAALSYLCARTDFRFEPSVDVIHLTLDRVTDEVGPVPISYTFPDSMIRIAPGFAKPLADTSAMALLRDTVVPQPILGEILHDCRGSQMEEIPGIAQAFVVSELVHELYHDWQNRSARFRTVDQARAVLRAGRGDLGPSWRSFLSGRGFDMRRHDQELVAAELEACTVQRQFWIHRYGAHPRHPLAREILSLMEDARAYYQAQPGPS